MTKARITGLFFCLILIFLKHAPLSAQVNLPHPAVLPECIDSSFKKYFNAPGYLYIPLKTTSAPDGSIFVTGAVDNTNDGDLWLHTFLVKFDNQGNVVWGKTYPNPVKTGSEGARILVMKDGSIVITGRHWDSRLVDQNNQMQADLLVMKLTPVGDLLWTKTFSSVQATCNGDAAIFIEQMCEGRNGDILLAGVVQNCYLPTLEIAIRLNNTGNIVWNKSFRESSEWARGFGMFYVNGEVWLIGTSGTSLGGQQERNIHRIRLNYDNADVIEQVAYKPQFTGYAEMESIFSLKGLSATLTDNNEVIVYGRLVGANESSFFKELRTFGVTKFDRDFRFIDGYVIDSYIKPANENANDIYVDKNGTAYFSLVRWYNFYYYDVFEGVLNANRQLIRKKKTELRNINTGLFTDFLPNDDGSFNLVRVHTDISQPNPLPTLLVSKLHMSDTASVCYGIDTNFIRTRSINYLPFNATWDTIRTNTLFETRNAFSQQSFTLNLVDECRQNSYCDTIAVHGPSTVCADGAAVQFTAFRSRACGAIVNWQIDNSAIDTTWSSNDTTLNIKFHSAWQGYLYADIWSKCGVVKDSLFVIVHSSQSAPDLGPDTSICKGAAIILNAGRGYVSYRWQDGSADSVFVANGAGKYYLDVTDICGNKYSDTIRVSGAVPLPVDLGADQAVCPGTMRVLSAPADFMSYQWTNSTGNDTLRTRNFNVAINTPVNIYLQARSANGCFSYDTVRYSVLPVPVIDLGKDTSLCPGQQILLDAGAGFTSYYWNNGSVSRTTEAKSMGLYFVTGTTVNGCTDTDSIIVNLNPLPQVPVPQVIALCEGQPLVLDAGRGHSTYMWSTGSRDRTIEVNQTGTYNVVVTDQNGCYASAVFPVDITVQPPSGFLGPDTATCDFNNFLVTTSQSFRTYMWSTGEDGPAAAIKGTGQYWLQVTDEFLCKGTDTINVFLKECLSDIYFPNAFTPNSDNRNDIFRPVAQRDVLYYELAIFNRFGQRVFYSRNINHGWNGTLNGLPQDSNTFVWTCSFQLRDQPRMQKKGILQLIR